jgi:hypothetical protein
LYPAPKFFTRFLSDNAAVIGPVPNKPAMRAAGIRMNAVGEDGREELPVACPRVFSFGKTCWELFEFQGVLSAAIGD